MAQGLLDVIAENFVLLFMLVVAVIVLLAILRFLNAWVDGRKARVMAQYETDMAKLEITKRKAMMEEMRNSAVLLNDSEREQLDRIRADKAILSRKLLFDINQTEDRLSRLELGADTVHVKGMLGDIKSKERSLFGRER